MERVGFVAVCGFYFSLDMVTYVLCALLFEGL